MIVEFKNVSKHFDNGTFIDKVSFSVKSKSILGIVGTTGIGKTEILKMICGYYKPDAGEIVYNKDLLGNQFFKNISYLPEIDKLNINLTLYEYLEFYCNLYGISKIETENRINDLLYFVDLNNSKYKIVKELTKFEEIKLGLARSLVHIPKIILMDEPFNRLDISSRNNLKNLIGDLNLSGITFVIVSHLFSDLSDFCSDVVLFNEHKIVVSGTRNYCIEIINRNNPLKIEVLAKDVEQAYKTLANSSLVSKIVKNDNKFYIYFSENDNKNILQSRLLSILVSQGIMPTLFAREYREDFDINMLGTTNMEVVYEV